MCLFFKHILSHNATLDPNSLCTPTAPRKCHNVAKAKSLKRKNTTVIYSVTAWHITKKKELIDRTQKEKDQKQWALKWREEGREGERQRRQRQNSGFAHQGKLIIVPSSRHVVTESHTGSIIFTVNSGSTLGGTDPIKMEEVKKKSIYEKQKNKQTNNNNIPPNCTPSNCALLRDNNDKAMTARTATVFAIIIIVMCRWGCTFCCCCLFECCRRRRGVGVTDSQQPRKSRWKKTRF